MTNPPPPPAHAHARRLTIGQGYNTADEWNAAAYGHILGCVQSKLDEEREGGHAATARMVFRHLQAAQGRTLPQHAARLLPLSAARNVYLSHVLNICSTVTEPTVYSMEGAPVVPSSKDDLRRELLMHAALGACGAGRGQGRCVLCAVRCALCGSEALHAYGA